VKFAYDVEVDVLRVLFSHAAIEESKRASMPHDSSKIKTTRYFGSFATQKHPEIERGWIKQVLERPLKTEKQTNNRISYWGNIEEAGGRALRVITLEDGETVHNAYFDRNFFRRQQRGEEPK
jgi:hypothetical protein